RRRHTRFDCDWSSDVCSSDLGRAVYEVDVFEAIVVVIEHRDSGRHCLDLVFTGTRGILQHELYVRGFCRVLECNWHKGRLPACRSEERRVGKGGRAWWAWYRE